MSTLEEIRRKRFEELMQAQSQNSQAQANEEAQLQRQIDAMEALVKQFLSREALLRYGNIKSAHSEKALQVLALLFQAIQKGQLKSKIDDTTFKKILEQLTPKKREIKIKKV